MPSWRQSLCRHYGLCSRSLKLFKRRVNSIHQIVWNCEEISKTIWPPNVCVLFVRRDTLVSVLVPAGERPCFFVPRPIRERRSFVPTFHALRSKLRLSPAEQKKLYKGLEKLAQNFVFLWHPRLFSPRHQICVSHINFSPQMEKHVWGSISHDTQFRR